MNSNTGKNAARSAIIIIIFTLGSKVLGFLRETLIAYRFGSGMQTDAFVIALTATSVVTKLISNAISTTFIPILSEIESKEGKEGKISHTNNLLNITGLIGMGLVILSWVIAPTLVRLFAKGFEDEQFALTVNLVKIGAPMVFFDVISGVIRGYLQSEQRHASNAAVGVPFNVIYIFFLLVFGSTFGIEGLMVTTVIATISQLLILLPETIMSGFKYKFTFDIKDRYIKKAIYLSLPIFIGVAINDINAIVDKRLASYLVEGSISALNYANKLKSLILSIFISAITTVVYPILSKEVSNENMDGVKRIINYGIDLIFLITIPATVGLVILAEPIVRVAFQKGEFDNIATMMTAQALLFYSISIVISALRSLITRVYYSLHDTKTPTINSVITVATNIIFNLILMGPMGHAGLALATSISITPSTIWMYYRLRNKIGNLGLKKHLQNGLKISAISLVMGAIAYFSYNGLFQLFGASLIGTAMALGLAVIISVLVYGTMCYVFNVNIIRDMVDTGTYNLKKLVNGRKK